MISAFADQALGRAVWLENGNRPAVTFQLSVSFLGAGSLDDLLICEVELVHRTKTLFFMRGKIMSGSRPVADAAGTWKVLHSG